MKLKTIEIKPLHMKPLKLTQNGTPIEHTTSSFSETVLPDAGNQPTPTREDIARLHRRKSDIVDPIVTSSLRKHPQDVLHGSRSLSLIIGNHFKRTPNDWDIYSNAEKQRALELEAQIDKKAGCDIAQTTYRHIPTTPFSKPDPLTGEHLYRVTTPKITGDSDIDIMDKPNNLPVERHKGITHEALIEQYRKASTRRIRQPLHSGKAQSDMRSIESYYKSKGRRISPLQDTPPYKSIRYKRKD